MYDTCCIIKTIEYRPRAKYTAQAESDGKKHHGKTKRKKQKHSFILSLALLLAVGYFVISFVSTQLDIREKEKEAAALQSR